MKRENLLLFLILLLSMPAYAQEGIRLLHGPYLQNLGSEEVTIVWLSDKPSVGWVELAPDDNSDFYATERPRYFDAKNGVKNTSTIHAVKIKGLKPGTNYRYRVFVQEVLSHVAHQVIYGYYASTDVYSREPLVFKTSDPANKNTSFAMVNDIHGNNDVLEKLVSKCDLKNTDFIIFNGDMVSVFNEEKHIFDGFMDTATRLFASRVPMYYTRGNHETRGAFATEFQRYFSPKEENIYYTFRQGPICFVILDTGEDKPDSDIEYAGITVYDEYRTEQAEWLRQVLDSKEYKEAPFKIVVAHIPPMGGWHGNLEVENKFMPLLRDAKPDLMLCGHLHRFIHQKATKETPFPIIVNSNTAILKATANPTELKIEVIDVDGKVLDQFSVKR
ncbi:metallophosphoesterase family protein [Parabacteroides sp. AM08-6]|uniref:purple acid phosphatase family protein n=1 Tax=Parabacteroides sp. AM08-6 TaxID=2292053 RepID=UPI000F002ABE|nr:metallophosphoesterase family protein [Parabacteroides sp. AM08-6]RHJ86673.1 purple acid phosphatase [Parabacteroides sp. AM08-6]